MINKLKSIVQRYNELTIELSNPDVVSNIERFKDLSKELSDLTDIHLGLNENNFPVSLVGLHSAQAEILIRQILIKNYRRICTLIMQSKGAGRPASIPVPKPWLDSLESNGIHINRLGSKISLYKTPQ